MKMVRFSSIRGPSLTQMAARKQLRKHIRRIREREYSKLRALIPSVASKKKVTKVQVIEEAVRYIEELHTALLERLRQKHGCEGESMAAAQETVKSFARLIMPDARPRVPDFFTHLHPNRTSLVPHPTNSVTTPPPLCPIPAFLSSCTFEKQRKRATFQLKKRRKDC